MTTPTNDERFEELLHSVHKKYGHQFNCMTAGARGPAVYDMSQHPAITALADHAATEIARLQAQVDALRHERDHARASTDNAVKLLTGIHSLLYPAPVTVADGRTMVFRPKSPDPHEVLQELSDRIRALPDELAALAAAGR